MTKDGGPVAWAFDALSAVSSTVHAWLGVEEGENFWIDGVILVVGGFLAFWLFMVVAMAAVAAAGALLAILWPALAVVAVLFFIGSIGEND